MPKLKLLVDSYEQPGPHDDPRGVRDLTEIRKGQTFEASAAEAERLKEIGAALDPKEAAAKARSDAEAEAQRLRDQASALEAEAKAAEAAPDENNLDSLTKPELVTYLEDHDADTSGTKPELLARAQAIQADEG
jgi:hypothetical protein